VVDLVVVANPVEVMVVDPVEVAAVVDLGRAVVVVG
jgi:hypothetical protein